MKFHGMSYYYRTKKKMVILNSKVKTILPELMECNLKLGGRLKDKLKVSSFFNSLEHRNKNYLHNFISSSDKRIRDLKIGVQMDKVLKHSSQEISALCNHMNEDITIKNMNKLIKEKKLVCEKTEEETHSKIKELLNNLKSAIKNNNNEKKEVEVKNEKSFSQNDINEVKEFIGNKIKNEEKKTDDKIKNYLKKLNYIFKNCELDEKKYESTEDEEYRKIYFKRKKAIHKLSDNFYLRKNIRLLNYKKPRPFQSKDKEGASLQRIKNSLYPSLLEKLMMEKQEKEEMKEELNKTESSLHTDTIISNESDNEIKNNRNRNSSLGYINSNITPSNFEINKLENEFDKIKTNGKDTLQILNNLSSQNKFLRERFNEKLGKVNSLLDLNLPYPKNYQLLLSYSKLEKKKKNLKKSFSFFPYTTKNYTNKKIEDKNDGNRTLPHLNNSMKHRLAMLKGSIQNKKIDKSMFDSIFRSYIGFNTTKHDKTKIIKLNKNKNAIITMKYKSSIDNIKQRKSESLFITLKKMRDEHNKIYIRKIKSCNFKKNE